MTIEVKRDELIIEADNVKIIETVFEGVYAVKEDGKKDYNKRLGDDVTEEGLNLLAKPLEDLIYYRKTEYDSLELIKQLYARLPDEKAKELFEIISEDFDS